MFNHKPGILVLCAIVSAPCLAGLPTPQGNRVLEPFDLRGVTLNDGPLLRQVLEVRDDYLRVPNDDYLKGFRQRAGLPAPGTDLGGWYGSGTFHVFGQVLSGLARMYAGTGDEACREKLNALIDGWAQCIAKDGYFFSTPDPRPPHYIYEKMVCGLLDAHLYAGNPNALKHLSRITDWAEKNLDHSNQVKFKTLIGITEWYTLSENLYRAYLATGETRYRDFAKSWEYTAYWNLYADGKDIFGPSPGYHAYSHVNTLSGAAVAYLVTGETRYLDVVRNAYDYIQAHQLFATGGYGPGEQFLPEAQLVETLDTMDNHFETQCGSWAAFKLSRYLMSFTGDARYGDWVERLVINGIGACIPMTSSGEVMYYARYGLSGGAKIITMPPWPCCAGTRIQAIADYHDLVFFKDANSLYVNLFTPATVQWDHQGTPVTVRQETRFPESDQAVMRISLPHDDEFAIKLRRPGWLAGPMGVAVNDRPEPASVDAKHWVVVRRRWHDGDRLTIRLPMRFTAERFPAASATPFPAAVTYGPVVMAFRSPEKNPGRAVNFANLDAAFVPVPGEQLVYHLAGDASVLVRPYYQFKQSERYYLYLDPAHTWTRLPPSTVKFSSGWAPNITGEMQITTRPAEYLECPFEGNAIRWIGRKFDDAGKTEVMIDGKVVATVDQYDPARDVPFRYEVRNLAEGRHTIRLTVLADKNPASKERYVNIIALDVLEASAGTSQSRPGTAPVP
jgi:uncharacterized protein